MKISIDKGELEIERENLTARDEDPTFIPTDPDPARLEKYSGSGSDLKSK